MLTSPVVVFLSPQTRCLGSNCGMDDEGNASCCHMKGIYCILILVCRLIIMLQKLP